MDLKHVVEAVDQLITTNSVLTLFGLKTRFIFASHAASSFGSLGRLKKLTRFVVCELLLQPGAQQ